MLRNLFALCLGLSLTVLSSQAVLAQGAAVAFGGLKQDATLPVEVSADNLEVSQETGSAVFSGNVEIGQGDIRLSAGTVRVEYGTASEIKRLHATGGVVFVTPTEAAEANEAIYTIASANVVMTGDVILTQGNSALSGQRLVIDLAVGKGTMEGRVTTIFNPGQAQ